MPRVVLPDGVAPHLSASALMETTAVRDPTLMPRHITSQVLDRLQWSPSRCGWPQPHPRGGTISPETHRQRLRMSALVLRADHRVGLARRLGTQPGDQRGHSEKARPVTEVPREPAATRLLAMFGTQDISPQYRLGSAVVPSPKVAPHCRAPKLPLGLPEQFSLRPEAVRCEPSTWPTWVQPITSAGRSPGPD